MRLAAEALGVDLKLLAINHWNIAISTHSKNHPWADHLCENLDNVNPRKIVPDGYLDLLVASPECTFHSRARGGSVVNDQSRASAWHVLRWAEALYIENILIENVPEFQFWGPLDKEGLPIKRLKGKTYLAFISALESLGYAVEARVINAADYGDPTTRKRLFIMARRGKPVCWPEPTHAKNTAGTLMDGPAHPWRPAREIIDWSIPGQSIFAREKPLSENTMRRIAAGLRKYCDLPFIVRMNGTKDDSINSSAISIDSPVPTVVGSATHLYLAQPFLVQYHGDKAGSERTASLDNPLQTIDTSNRLGLVEPFIVTLNHGRDDNRAYSLDDPMRAITSADVWGLVSPFLVKYNGTGETCSVDEPLDTVTGKDRFGLAIVLQDGRSAVVDVHFRMLQPHELAAAMSFPKEYAFDGTREQKVKQIGNAVPVRTAQALCQALMV